MTGKKNFEQALYCIECGVTARKDTPVYSSYDRKVNLCRTCYFRELEKKRGRKEGV
jgi:hypothetical protein